MSRRLALMGMTLLYGCSFATAECQDGLAWTSARDGMEILAYPKPGSALQEQVLFDGRMDGKLVWRVKADSTCTNGNGLCWLSVPLTSGEVIEVSETVIFDEGAFQYVVFANLAEEISVLHSSSGGEETVVAEVLDAAALAATGSDPAIMLPSYMKYAGCSIAE